MDISYTHFMNKYDTLSTHSCGLLIFMVWARPLRLRGKGNLKATANYDMFGIIVSVQKTISCFNMIESQKKMVFPVWRGWTWLTSTPSNTSPTPNETTKYEVCPFTWFVTWQRCGSGLVRFRESLWFGLKWCFVEVRGFVVEVWDRGSAFKKLWKRETNSDLTS